MAETLKKLHLGSLILECGACASACHALLPPNLSYCSTSEDLLSVFTAPSLRATTAETPSHHILCGCDPEKTISTCYYDSSAQLFQPIKMETTCSWQSQDPALQISNNMYASQPQQAGFHSVAVDTRRRPTVPTCQALVSGACRVGRTCCATADRWVAACAAVAHCAERLVGASARLESCVARKRKKEERALQP
jgi:hypothetical protein